MMYSQGDTSRGRCGLTGSLRGFSLVEVIVSVTLLGLMLTMLLTMAGTVQNSWQIVKGKADQFQEARNGFEAITRNLSQATLNTYWSYDDNRDPTTYVPQSELHFVSGETSELLGKSKRDFPGHAVFFQAPFGYSGGGRRGDFVGYDGLLNTWGYFIEYRSDKDDQPQVLRSRLGDRDGKRRFRLVEFRPPSQDMRVYDQELRNSTSTDRRSYTRWFNSSRKGGVFYSPTRSRSESRTTRVLSDNIILLVLSPRESTEKGASAQEQRRATRISPDYAYDSRRWQWQSGGDPLGGDEIARQTQHVLPPVIDVTMVAIDEGSAQRLDLLLGESATAPDLVPRNLFRQAARYDRDIEKLEERLSGRDGVLPTRVNYRVFRSTVKMRTSKWSESVSRREAQQDTAP